MIPYHQDNGAAETALKVVKQSFSGGFPYRTTELTEFANKEAKHKLNTKAIWENQVIVPSNRKASYDHSNQLC